MTKAEGPQKRAYSFEVKRAYMKNSSSGARSGGDLFSRRGVQNMDRFLVNPRPKPQPKPKPKPMNFMEKVISIKHDESRTHACTGWRGSGRLDWTCPPWPRVS